MQTNQDKLQVEDPEPWSQELRLLIQSQAPRAVTVITSTRKFVQVCKHPHPKENQRKQKSYLKDATKEQESLQPIPLQ